MTSDLRPLVTLTFVTYRTTAARGDWPHIAAARGDGPGTTTSPAMNTAACAYPTHTPKPNPSPRAEHQRRESEYLALRQLADQVQRLDRQLHRERSYATAHYAG
jgi:hypothetical protein